MDAPFKIETINDMDRALVTYIETLLVMLGQSIKEKIETWR